MAKDNARLIARISRHIGSQGASCSLVHVCVHLNEGILHPVHEDRVICLALFPSSMVTRKYGHL
eukprot:4980552-Amphidinium_carterae.1